MWDIVGFNGIWHDSMAYDGIGSDLMGYSVLWDVTGFLDWVILNFVILFNRQQPVLSKAEK